MLIKTIIDDALIEIGVKSPIDDVAQEEYDYGLRVLNRIIDTYNTQNLLITQIEDIAVTPPKYISINQVVQNGEPILHNGKEIWHTLDDETVYWTNPINMRYVDIWDDAYEEVNDHFINELPPVEIQGLFWRQIGNDTDFTSKPMTLNEWASIGYKQASSIPSRHYIQRNRDNTLTLYFDALPLDNLELHLLAKRPYTGKNKEGSYHTPDDDVQFNYGFEKMLLYRLASELSGSYGVEISPSLLAKAAEAEDQVKAFNYQPYTLKKDTTLSKFRRGCTSRYNLARF